MVKNIHQTLIKVIFLKIRQLHRYVYSEDQSSIPLQDEINGGSVQRTEERDGLALKGQYTYSDGFFKRTGKLCQLR